MGSRSRRSASRVISAAILEVFIMGLFVIIAQPQLRDALMGMLHPVEAGNTVSAAAIPSSIQPNQNLASSSQLGGQHSASRPTFSSDSAPLALPSVSQLAGMAASALQGLANGTSTQRPAEFAPLEHYESFRVSVPDAGVQQPAVQQAQADYNRPLPSTSNRIASLPATSEIPSLANVPVNHQTYTSHVNPPAGPVYPSIPAAHMVPHPNYQNNYQANHQANHQVNYQSNNQANYQAGYQASAPTQLVQGQWNIASAAQSPYPNHGWNVVRPAETSYTEPYPPPYGTQSQWK